MQLDAKNPQKTLDIDYHTFTGQYDVAFSAIGAALVPPVNRWELCNLTDDLVMRDFMIKDYEVHQPREASSVRWLIRLCW